jgi:hypothetical protein
MTLAQAGIHASKSIQWGGLWSHWHVDEVAWVPAFAGMTPVSWSERTWP